MSDFREEEKLGKVYDTQITRRLLKYLWPYRWQVVARCVDDVRRRRRGIRRTLPVSYCGRPLYRSRRSASISRHAALIGVVWMVLAFLATLLASFGLQYVQVRIMQ